MFEPTALDRVSREVVAQIVALLGKTVTLVRTSSSTMNRITLTASQSKMEVPVKAVVHHYSAREIRGALELGDVAVLYSAELLGDEPPTIHDHTVIDGAAYKHKDIQAIYSGEQVACWIVTAHQSSGKA